MKTGWCSAVCANVGAMSIEESAIAIQSNRISYFRPTSRHDRLAARVALSAAETRFQIKHPDSLVHDWGRGSPPHRREIVSNCAGSAGYVTCYPPSYPPQMKRRNAKTNE